MPPTEPILLVEDDRELRVFLDEVLREEGYEVEALPSAERGVERLASPEPLGLIITDLVMPGKGGGHLLNEARRLRPELNVVVITAFGSIDSAIELTKAGAYGYLTKPFRTEELLLTVERALADSRSRRELAALKRSADPPPGFIGGSPAMEELFRLIRRVAPSGLPALVTGETGSGKEVVARALHHLSGRDPFVPVNCAALPEQLLESELFGHEKGAFTGADREKEGLFEAADGGTLFLDEVGELPLALQPKLLRALEEGEVRRLGSSRPRPVAARIVAATNRDLRGAVERGAFREDLFFRLDVVTLSVPPLRDRPRDIPPLVDHFLGRLRRPGGERPTAFSSAALEALTRYPWPGNVRELRNVVETAATLADGDVVELGDLPPRVRDAPPTSASLGRLAEGRVPLREMERRYILEVLATTGGNRSRTAEILGMDRKTLYRKLQEYDEGPGETGRTAEEGGAGPEVGTGDDPPTSPP